MNPVPQGPPVYLWGTRAPSTHTHPVHSHRLATSQPEVMAPHHGPPSVEHSQGRGPKPTKICLIANQMLALKSVNISIHDSEK